MPYFTGIEPEELKIVLLCVIIQNQRYYTGRDLLTIKGIMYEMTSSIIEHNILSSDFQYLQPFFYNHPYSIRCELGVGDDDVYMQNAKKRAMDIYQLLFPNAADALFFDYWIYDQCFSGAAECEADYADDMEEIHEYSIQAEVAKLKFLYHFQDKYRHVIVKKLKGYENEEDEAFLGRNRVVCYSDGKGFNAEKLICTQIENQSLPLVSFVSFEGEFIFSVYDDRGCDIVFATPEAFAAHYNDLKPFFLEYDVDLMKSRMDEIEKNRK